MRYDVSQIEEMIYPFLPKEDEEFRISAIQAANYGFKAGGKRLRPMMMRLVFDMLYNKPAVTKSDEYVIRAFMAALEMIHTHSLIHDDLPALDNDELRRGLPTVHAKYGEAMGVLAGDILLNHAYETVAEAMLEKPGDVCLIEAFRRLAVNSGASGMLGGQSLDVEKTGCPLEAHELAFIYENKTAALIECALMCGAILAGASRETVAGLEKAGSNIGIAFQIRDDILDIAGDEAKLGKPVNSDNENDKYTYVRIHGKEESEARVKQLTDEAVELIESIDAVDKEAADDLIHLFRSLTDRDR